MLQWIYTDRKWVDSSKPRNVFFELLKAFDTVSHEVLLQNYNYNYRFRGKRSKLKIK